MFILLQVSEFIEEEVKPVLVKYEGKINETHVTLNI